MPDKAIIVQGITKSYKDLKVLDGVSFSVERGTMLALLGPNGAGKTTTIRILSTLLTPDGGKATVNGFDVVDQDHQVRESVGLTGQYAAVDEFLNGQENLEMMGRLYHLSKETSKQRADELLEQFDLVDAAHRPAKDYSGGMRRRLDLAASLVATPPILFLDEPTTGLDPRSRLQMWEVIEKLMKQGATILLTTQYLEEADKLADRIAVLDHGKIIAEGTADELKARVGKDRLEIMLSHGEDFEKALQLLEEDKITFKNQHERSIGIATGGDVKEVKRILDLLENAHISLDSFNLHKPTLDDVFLFLTGRAAEKAEELTEGNKNA